MRSAVSFRLMAAAALLGLPQPVLADGSCVAFVDDGVLTVLGDGGDNNVFVTEVAPGTWEVAGEDGTLVNGLASDLFSEEVEDILVDLGEGDDLSTISGEIPGDLTVFGGEDRNEFLLIDATVGGDVLVENAGSGETDFEGSLIERDLDVVNDVGFDEFKLDGASVLGDVGIDNGDGDPETGEGSVTDVEAGSFVGGDFVVRNGEGFDALDVGETEIGGNLDVANKDGSEVTGEGSTTDVEALIGGDLKIVNKTGSDEVEVEESEIGGDVTIKNQSGPSDISIQEAAIGGSLLVDNKEGFDALELAAVEVEEDVTVKLSSGGSEIFVGEETTVGGDLAIETKNGVDTLTLEGLAVEGDSSVYTGPAADSVTVIASAFAEALAVDGSSGADTFVDGGGNGFSGGLELTSIGL